MIYKTSFITLRSIRIIPQIHHGSAIPTEEDPMYSPSGLIPLPPAGVSIHILYRGQGVTEDPQTLPKITGIIPLTSVRGSPYIYR
jgi:hypothetical protein